MADSDDAALAGLATVTIAFGSLAIAIAGTAFETWTALVIWRWFLPMPLPLTFLQAVAANLIISLIVRRGAQCKDNRTTGEQVSAAISHVVFAPLVFLLSAWVLRLWL